MKLTKSTRFELANIARSVRVDRAAGDRLRIQYALVRERLVDAFDDGIHFWYEINEAGRAALRETAKAPRLTLAGAQRSALLTLARWHRRHLDGDASEWRPTDRHASEAACKSLERHGLAAVRPRDYGYANITARITDAGTALAASLNAGRST